MGASATHLRKLDSVQKFAEKLVALLFHLSHLVPMLVPLVCYASYKICCVGILFRAFARLLHLCIKYPYSFRHVEDDDFFVTRYNSLDLFIN